MIIFRHKQILRQSPTGAVLALAAFALPPLATVAPLGLAPLLAVVGLTLLIFDRQRVLEALGDLLGIAALLAVLSAWCMLSATWSILPVHSFLEGLRLLAISAAGLVCLGVARTLPTPEAERLGWAAAIGVAVAILVLLAARFTDLEPFHAMRQRAPEMPFARFDRGATILALALWPAVAGMASRRWLMVALVAAVGLAVFGMVSTAAKLALSVGVGLFAAAYRWPRLVAGMLAAGIAAITIILPLATPSPSEVVRIHQSAPWLKPSAIHRLLIWRFTADRIAERPLLGWGMDASRELPGGHLSLAELVPAADPPEHGEQLPLHPHNAVLQWEVELGLPGILLCLGIVAWALARVVRRPSPSPLHRATALAWAGTALVISMLSYGIWQAWWLSGLWLTAALCRGIGAGEDRGSAPASSARLSRPLDRDNAHLAGRPERESETA